MKQLNKGIFFGKQQRKTDIEYLRLTQTEFGNQHVDWHFHENVHFSYLLEGSGREITPDGTIPIRSGALIFHNAQTPHSNDSHSDYSRSFYLEIEDTWFRQFDLEPSGFADSQELTSPHLKWVFDKLYLEGNFQNTETCLSVETLLSDLLSQMNNASSIKTFRNPKWVGRLKELLHYQFTEHLTLTYLSKQIGVHPVHISREFSRYFGSTFGDYLRMLKVQNAASLLKTNSIPFADIALQCGFSDQSHFIRSFRSHYKMTPSEYRYIALS